MYTANDKNKKKAAALKVLCVNCLNLCDLSEVWFTIPINESYHSISVCCIKLLCKNESKKNFKSALLNIQGSPLFYTLYRSLNMERFIYI